MHIFLEKNTHLRNILACKIQDRHPSTKLKVTVHGKHKSLVFTEEYYIVNINRDTIERIDNLKTLYLNNDATLVFGLKDHLKLTN